MSSEPIGVAEEEPLEQRKRYSIFRALMGVFLLPAILWVATLGVIWILQNSGGNFDPTVGFALSSSTFLVASLIYIAGTGKIREIWSFLKLRVFKWWHILVGLGGAVFTYMVASLLGMIAVLINMGVTGSTPGTEGGTDLGENTTSQVIGGLTQTHSIIFVGFLVAILAPVAEEIFFRGALLSSIVQESTSKWLKVLAVVLVSVIFGIFHFQGSLTTFADVLAMVTPGLVGVTAAILTLVFNSLYPAIFTHLFYNGIVLVIITVASQQGA